MPAKKCTSGISAADVDAKLPRTFFVMRGHVQTAFGLSREEVNALVGQGIFRAEYPIAAHQGAKGKPKARFVRSQVLAVARKWEATG